MDFSWTTEQLEFKQSVIEFASKELNGDIVDRDLHGEFSRRSWEKCARFGIQGLPVPEEYGGLGADILTAMLAMEALGYSCKDNGLIFGINAQMWSVQHPILKFGTPEQKQKYLPRLCSGEIIGAHGMSEPDSGSDAYSLKLRAEPCGDGYLLNGTKTLVTNAPIADVAVVFGTVDPGKGRWGITAFIVEAGTPGFSSSRNMHKMGLRTSPIGELIFQDCYVPEENRLGAEGAGAAIFNSSMEWERACILAGAVGAMERQLGDCLNYARDRRQFGQSIGKFQSISKVAWLIKSGKSAALEAAMAKLYVSEAYVQSSLDAIRIHGGYGYMTEFEVERSLRDAIGGTLYSGTSDIQRNIIARLLGV